MGAVCILAGSTPGPLEAFSRPLAGWKAGPVRGRCLSGGPLITTRRWHLTLQGRALRRRTQGLSESRA